MLSEETKRSIDRIWNTFWANETTNPLTVVEQITFVIFSKLLDRVKSSGENEGLIATLGQGTAKLKSA